MTFNGVIERVFLLACDLNYVNEGVIIVSEKLKLYNFTN